jgi:hypothetical protein
MPGRNLIGAIDHFLSWTDGGGCSAHSILIGGAAAIFDLAQISSWIGSLSAVPWRMPGNTAQGRWRRALHFKAIFWRAPARPACPCSGIERGPHMEAAVSARASSCNGETEEWALISPELDTVTTAKRFYFHIVKGNVRVADRVGFELREETMNSREVFKAIKERWPGTSDFATWRGWSVEIVDMDGELVRTVPLDELN